MTDLSSERTVFDDYGVHPVALGAIPDTWLWTFWFNGDECNSLLERNGDVLLFESCDDLWTYALKSQDEAAKAWQTLVLQELVIATSSHPELRREGVVTRHPIWHVSIHYLVLCQ